MFIITRDHERAKNDLEHVVGLLDIPFSRYRVSVSPGRKTLVVVSGGLLASDRIGGKPDIRLETFAFAHEAATSNVNMYVLHMDNSFLDAYSANGAKNFTSQMRDSGVLALGLELVAGAAGASLVHVEGTMPERAFDRVARETSAYYLLGVEPADADRDGKIHHIHVDVKQHGATVRSRVTVMIPIARKERSISEEFR